MKLKTLKEIEGALIAVARSKGEFYEAYKNMLEQKYNTVWVQNMATGEELERLDQARSEKIRADEALEDFTEHEW